VIAAHASTAVAAFGGSTKTSAIDPPLDRDHRGIGDLWIMPLELSWRLPHVDFVVDYAFYVPIGTFRHDAAIGGLGTGHWAHEFSIGSALYLDEARTWSLSMLATFAMNGKDRNVDITPGDVLNLEGGAGKRFFGVLDLGVVSFAHWQVGTNSGADVREDRRHEHNQLYSVGGEADITIQALHTVLTMRYVYDVHAQTRLAGQSLIGVITFAAWSPSGKARPEGAPIPGLGR
jgi:hypothetical protein